MLNGLENRPDLQALRLQSQFVEGTARMYEILYRPSLGVQGKLGILAYEPDQLGSWQNREWQVGIGLHWPLFDGFANNARARKARSDARTLAMTANQATDLARIEIENALGERTASDSALTAARQGLAAAEEARALVDADFKAGAGQLIDLMATEQSLREAQLNLLNAEYLRIRSIAALQTAMGRNLIESEER